MPDGHEGSYQGVNGGNAIVRQPSEQIIQIYVADNETLSGVFDNIHRFPETHLLTIRPVPGKKLLSETNYPDAYPSHGKVND